MEIRVLEEAPTRRVLELTVAREEVERHLDRVASDLQRRAAMPGFRKGRVPRTLIEARFGSSLQQEALEGAVEEAYGRAVEEQQLTPVSLPRIEDVSYGPGEPLRFRATLEVRPVVEAKEYRGLPLVRKVRDITDEAIEILMSFVSRMPSTVSGVGLQQMHGRRVADDVRRDASLGKLGLGGPGGGNRKREPLGHVAAAHGLAIAVGQQR